MFEDQNQSASSGQPGTAADKAQSNTPPAPISEEKPITPGTAVPPPMPAGDKKEAKSPQGESPLTKEPEDIFGASEPAPPAAAPVPAAGAEPSLKPPPSPFVKKSAPTGEAPKDMPPMPGTPPPMPKTGLDKKTLLTFIIVVIVVIALIIAGIWWFSGRKGSNSSDINPAVVNLFTNTENINKEVKKNEPVELPKDNTPQAPADTDGDGLSDEEEASLGTSINAPDTDNDGLYDREEVKIYGTDPLKSDTDGDGWKDGEEVQKNQDPLSPDPGPKPKNYFQSPNYHFGFIYPQEMVFESAQNNIVQFNDNFNQIKLYIYIAGSQPSFPAPDISYTVGQQGNRLIIKDSYKNSSDDTPYSTQFATQSYRAANGTTYLIRYLATKRAEDHQAKFEAILKSFEFL